MYGCEIWNIEKANMETFEVCYKRMLGIKGMYKMINERISETIIFWRVIDKTECGALDEASRTVMEGAVRGRNLQ